MMRDLHLEKLDLNVGIAYIKAYCIEFPCIMIHELSHWWMTIILHIFTFGELLSLPSKIKITRKWSIEKNDTVSHNVYGWSARVEHSIDIYSKTENFASMLVSAAPAITTLILLYIMPWYICAFIVLQFEHFWVSRGDVIQIVSYFKNGYVNENLYMERKLRDSLCKTQRMENLKKEII